MSIEIKKELERIKNDETKLYSYLYDLVYMEISKNTRFLESIYSSFLKDNRIEIRRIAIYCLLFGLKIRNPEYREFALLNLKDKEIDFDMRLFCASGLAAAYMGTDDKELLFTLNSIFNDPEEDEDLAAKCFEGMMQILGMSSVEIVRRNQNKIIFTLKDLHLHEFEEELSKVKEILS